MSKHFDSLDDTFDVESEIVKPVKVEKDSPVAHNRLEERDKDYRHARSELYRLVDKMQEAVDGALEVAQESDHPRAYEVAINGMKNAADVVDKLADLHKKMNALEKDEPTQVHQTNTQNNIYMGTTEEILKLIKDGNKKEEKP